MQNGSVFVFMLFVMAFAGLSVYLRTRYREKVNY